ncbi:MAG: O-antigen translocase, partial [Odoribacter sp.]
MVSAILGAFFSIVLVLSFGLKGALISTVTFQSVMLFVTLQMLRKLPWFSWEYFKHKYNIVVGRKYMGYSLMTLVSVALVPVSQLILRGHIIVHISEIEAGWWEAMNRISGMYLMVITTSFSIYYLPRLAEINDIKELRKEIFKAYKMIIPILLVGFSFVYFTRFLIIRILFTPDFIL